MSLRHRLLSHYAPLLKDFCEEIRGLDHPDIERMPEPFLPAFGAAYEKSAIRSIVIGQDTAGWGDLRHFLDDPRSTSGGRLDDHLDEFQDHDFTGWGSTRYTFWGFVMMLLASLHGQDNWGAMKQGAMTEILDSFAWGNGNAIELHSSTNKRKLNIPWEYWEQVRKAGERFNRFSHIVETLRPHVAVILWKGMNPRTYFEGLEYECVSEGDGVTHYRILPGAIDVLHCPHPNNMKFTEGAEHFQGKIRELFEQRGMLAVFPEFLAGQAEGLAVMNFLLEHAPLHQEADKFEFVAWVADELKKRGTFMSVPALCDLLNSRGYTTNYGNEYSAGRGSYRLISASYHRQAGAGSADRAHNVAVAFRRPNFDYAYSVGD
jgi:hypothetical protein